MKQIETIMLALLLLTGCSGKSRENRAAETAPQTEGKPYCLVVGSYHREYEGQALLIQGIEEELNGVMELIYADMDTKNHPDPAFARERADEILRDIHSRPPDILIAMDDNASAYLVEPYLKDGPFPVVFVGVNWSAEKYGYPYANATGMIEVHPIGQAVEEIFRQVPDIRSACCLQPATESDRIHGEYFRREMESRGVVPTDISVADYGDFQRAYLSAQEFDLIYFTNYYGIQGWDDKNGLGWIGENTRTLSFSTNSWMNRYVTLGFNMDSVEQGRYAGRLARTILMDGRSPGEIPIVANQHYSVTLNRSFMEKAGLAFTQDFLIKARKVEP